MVLTGQPFLLAATDEHEVGVDVSANQGQRS